MIPTLQTIIPYIQENSLDDVPLTFLLKLLSNPTIINSASAVDQQTLLTRVTTLLKSNHNITRWKATKIFTVCLLHPILLLSSNTANSIAALVKILESKCFISDFQNPGQRELVTLKSTAECIDFVLDQIRGKPTLTREVLTPKLPTIIGSLIEATTFIPDVTIPILSKLLITNTTTFRPFGTKFENVLKNILNNGDNLAKVDSRLRCMLLKSLALVSFVLSRERQADAWRENVNALILEIKSVISIYEACLELSGDSDYNSKFQNLPKLPEDMSSIKMIFGSLSIDINESPVEIFKVSQRINILCELLLAYIELNTPTAVTIPFGHYITIGEILSSLNTGFTPVKKDIRDQATREMIEQSVIESKLAGINILNTLVKKFKGELYPHSYQILAILDAAVPIQTFRGKIRVFEKLVYENEYMMNSILHTASEYLKLTERFNDMSVLGRLVEAALILKEPREPNIPTENNNTHQELTSVSGNSKKKNNKNKSSISLSDILSHQQLFMTQPSAMTLTTLRDFFNTLLTHCELSPGKLSLVLRFVLIDSISNIDLIHNGTSAEKEQIIKLLESALLYPGRAPNSISIIPMIANLIGTDNVIFSLLTNPRFPLLPKKSNRSSDNEHDNITEEEELKEAEEFENGGFQIPDSENTKRNAEENIEAQREEKRQHVEETGNKVAFENNDLVFNKTEAAANVLKKMENHLKQEQNHPTISLVDDTARETEMAADDNVIASEEEEDEEMGSDFEIPEINVDDDE